MAATAQSHVDTLMAQVEQDSTITTAQKAQVFSLLYSAAVVLFGSNNASTVSITGNKSGRPNGHNG